MGSFSLWHWIIVLIIVVLVFGTKKLRNVGKDLGGVIPILQQAFDVKLPDASFYIWLKVPDGDDLAFTRNLWQKAAIQVLPGRFLARDTEQGNPGEGYVRIALVADVESCVKAAETMVALYRR